MNRLPFPRGNFPAKLQEMTDSPHDRNIRFLVSELTDPAVNLAVEETLFSRLPTGQALFFLYRNAPSVIFGRFQNPWLEADVEWLADQKIPMIRRSSGGGTVWHDLGNWNFFVKFEYFTCY